MPRTGLRIKPPELLVAESGADLEGHGLKRTIGPFQLVCFGVGAIVGTGIFVGLSDTVAEAGPAVLISFVLAAITCIFTAFSFAELGGAIRSPAAPTPTRTRAWGSAPRSSSAGACCWSTASRSPRSRSAGAST